MKIACLISGGVDSSVALYLAQQKYPDAQITAYYLKIWLEDEVQHLGNCPWEEDLAYVRAVCEHLKLPLEVLSFQQAYRERVVTYALAELKKGRTPSPDIFCNQRIKFGAFLEALRGNVDLVVSGHYASIEKTATVCKLLCAKDQVKDQTYFLAHLNQEQLRHAEFPLGPYLKSEVREIAKSVALPTAERKDSQGICFLGKIKYPEFVRYHLGVKRGEIREWGTEKRLGYHEGFWFHTYGQRKGLRLHGGPWFVVDKNVEENVVYVAHEHRLQESSRREFFVEDLHFIDETGKSDPLFVAEVKVRHGPTKYKAKVLRGEGRTRVKLDQPDPGLADGQFCVFYEGIYCLGLGAIRLN